MARYYLTFSKSGYIKYISHLDLQRLFKRTFKRLGIPIEYSKGFNPHPKMGFMQPLSLGYSGLEEYLEFNTIEPLNIDIAFRELKDAMPDGIVIQSLDNLDIKAKSLASIVYGAIYTIVLPLAYRFRFNDINDLVTEYLNQESIMAEKREKKSKIIVLKDIKDQIKSIDIIDYDGKIALVAKVDAGSNSNLSPEQIISSFSNFSKLYLPREHIEVIRDKILFKD